MQLDAQKYRAALGGLGSDPVVFVDPPDSFRAWLKDKGVPNELVAFLLANAIRDEVSFDGCGGMWPAQSIMALNDQESAILASGLLAVGSATNGDFIVIDLQEDVDGVGFVSHEDLWVDPPLKNVRAIYAPGDGSIHALLAGMTAEDHRLKEALQSCARSDFPAIIYPIDYCSALECGPKSRASK